MGIAPCVAMAMIVWPPSWYAVMRRTSGGIMVDFRSAPISTLSLAYSSSAIVMRGTFLDDARIAAEFTKLYKSAPELPGVPRANTHVSTSDCTEKAHTAGEQIESAG